MKSFSVVASALLLLLLVTATVAGQEGYSSGSSSNTNKPWKFGMASGGSSFFEPIRQGFEETCERLQVECEYFAENFTQFSIEYRDEFASYGQDKTRFNHCVPQIREMMDRGFDGISVYCGVDNPVLRQALDAGIVLTSFDIRPPGVEIPYVGTNNLRVGASMARLLRLLKDVEAGDTATYYAFSFTRVPERYQEFVKEIEKNHQNRDRGHWKMVTTNLTGRPLGDNLTIGEELFSWNQDEVLERLANLNPDAIIFMNQSPMRRPGYTDWVNRHRHRGITLVGLQGDDRELQTLARRNVDGLIGQVSYDIGRLSAENLYKLKAGEAVPPETYTKLINYNLVPEELPTVDVNENLISDLKIVGYLFFSIVACLALTCMAWTYIHRNGTVVRSSQPVFLIMMATGVLIMASAMIPLSFEATDDDINGKLSDEVWAEGICMSVPWLATIGFSVTFSALFSKTWRINRFFHSSERFARIQVGEKDVLGPFIAVVSLNCVVLVVWTVVDPLTYIREFEEGTDMFNREIASIGYCRSDHAEYFLAPLAIINLAVLVVASWQAYNARNIKSEFAEASYIAFAVFSLAQAFCTGIPVVAVVRDDPQAFYLVLTCILFVLSMVILLLIFLPKVFMERKYANMSPSEQRKLLAVSVRASSRKISGGSSSASGGKISGLFPPPTTTGQSPVVTAAKTVEPLVQVKEEEGEEHAQDIENNEETTDDPSKGSTPEYGSLVSKAEDVVESKKSTYASEAVDAELSALEEKESTTQRSSSMGVSADTE